MFGTFFLCRSEPSPTNFFNEYKYVVRGQKGRTFLDLRSVLQQERPMTMNTYFKKTLLWVRRHATKIATVVVTIGSGFGVIPAPLAAVLMVPLILFSGTKR